MNKVTKDYLRNIYKKVVKWYNNKNIITKKLSQEKLTALTIVVIYAVLSELWILLSDKYIISIVEVLNISTLNISTINIIKGSLYVIATSFLLYLTIYKNILKTKGLKNELQTSEERYSTLIELLPDAVTIDCNGKYVFTNNAGAKLLGLEKTDQIIGISIMDLIHPNYKKIAQKRINTVHHKRKSIYLTEEKYIRTNGEIVHVEVASTIFTHNGEPATLSVIRNITERKEMEKTLKKALEENKLLLEKMIELDRMKTEFFSNLSHEFKTPLNIIFSVIQLLSIQINNYETKIEYNKFNKYIGIMKQNCYRLLRLINNLIDITRIESGFFEINYKNQNIIDVIENIVLSVAEFAENKDISITFDTEVEEKVIACDNDKIERIILNILSNSIKNTKPGGSIYANIYDKEDNIIISIKDTGVGIPKDKLETIFERFTQVDSSLRRENEGSGIGLSLVKSIVEKLEGEIWVESEQGLGTEFFIKLPVRVLSDDEEELSNDNNKDRLVEKINIEFSDIYDIY